MIIIPTNCVSGMPVTIKGRGWGYQTLNIPSHSAGDLLIAIVGNFTNTTAPGKPSAGGTVPTWNIINNNAGDGYTAMTTAYAVATGSNTTGGTWTNWDYTGCIVISGQADSPLGGHAEQGSSSTANIVTPSVTLSKTDGSSLLIHMGVYYSAYSGSTRFNAPPSGYTRGGDWRIDAGGHAETQNSAVNIRYWTKNDTTSDGSATFTTVSSVDSYRAATIEILGQARDK